MEKSNKDQVEAAFGHATMEASAFMVELARDRAAARNERDLALDDRATQLAAIQFAAAAVGATIAGDRAPIIVIIVAAIASATFAVGGIWALRAARPDQVHLPGIPPLWTNLVRSYERTEPTWFQRFRHKLEILSLAHGLLALCTALAWVVTEAAKHPLGAPNGSAYRQGRGR